MEDVSAGRNRGWKDTTTRSSKDARRAVLVGSSRGRGSVCRGVRGTSSRLIISSRRTRLQTSALATSRNTVRECIGTLWSLRLWICGAQSSQMGCLSAQLRLSAVRQVWAGGGSCLSSASFRWRSAAAQTPIQSTRTRSTAPSRERKASSSQTQPARRTRTTVNWDRSNSRFILTVTIHG